MTTIIHLHANLALYERHELIRNAQRQIGLTNVLSVTVSRGDDQVEYENDADLAAATSATITHR